jgi:hypothetical protein
MALAQVQATEDTDGNESGPSLRPPAKHSAAVSYGEGAGCKRRPPSQHIIQLSKTTQTPRGR